MRSFTDSDGRRWDVVAGRESWGALVALFVPAGWSGDVMQAPLNAAGYEVAEQELDQMTPDEVQALLDGARPKS